MQLVKTGNSTPRVDDATPLEQRSLIWLAVGFGMLVMITLITVWALRQVNLSDYWVSHTRDIISHNQRLLSDLKDAESAERGYIITGDENYLQPYKVAADDIQPTLNELRQLTVDNPAQQQRLQKLDQLILQRIAVLNTALQQRRASGFEAAEQVVVAGQGRIVMQQIREVSQQVEQEENRLLEQRSSVRRTRLRDGFVTTVAASLLALLALLSATFDVRRATRQLEVARRARLESASTAQALLTSAAQAIVIVDQAGRIVMANPATEKMLGYGKNELIGQSIELLVPEKLRGVHVGHRSGYFQQPQSRPMGTGLDLQARRKDGSEFPAEISLSYIPSAKGTLGVAFVSDVSKRKADEQAIRQQREELRFLAVRLMTAQDDERRRIARNLHDDLSQKLAYLAMDIGKLATKPYPPEVVADLRSVQRRAAESSENVRQISHDLHPSILDDIGLEAAVEQYCEEFEKRSGIKTHFDSSGLPDLPREVASSVYHIFQESLRNVSKHSKAAEVFVIVEFVENALQLTVRDEGVGLPKERLKPGASIGIVGMKERAHLVNGTLSIESRTGEGTEVKVSVPLAVG